MKAPPYSTGKINSVHFKEQHSFDYYRWLILPASLHQMNIVPCSGWGYINYVHLCSSRRTSQSIQYCGTLLVMSIHLYCFLYVTHRAVDTFFLGSLVVTQSNAHYISVTCLIQVRLCMAGSMSEVAWFPLLASFSMAVKESSIHSWRHTVIRVNVE